jgi:hypothetical protein
MLVLLDRNHDLIISKLLTKSFIDNKPTKELINKLYIHRKVYSKSEKT